MQYYYVDGELLQCALLHVIVNAIHYERKDQKFHGIKTENFSMAVPKVYRIQIKVTVRDTS